MSTLPPELILPLGSENIDRKAPHLDAEGFVGCSGSLLFVAA